MTDEPIFNFDPTGSFAPEDQPYDRGCPSDASNTSDAGDLIAPTDLSQNDNPFNVAYQNGIENLTDWRSFVYQLEPGSELDTLVAEALEISPETFQPECRNHSTDQYEFDPVKHEASGWCYTCNQPASAGKYTPEHYSTDDAVAVRTIQKHFEKWEIGKIKLGSITTIYHPAVPYEQLDSPWSFRIATAPTLALSVCRAILLYQAFPPIGKLPLTA